jgi:hypothetical protein
MLEFVLEGGEMWDASREKFITIPKGLVVRLEHSLLSVSKWESIHEKPFIKRPHDPEKTIEEEISYIECMIIGRVQKGLPHYLYYRHGEELRDYISAKMTATVVKNSGRGNSGKYVSAELIYYWMIAFNIPFSCEKWHLNQLLTLIEVCQAEQDPKKASMNSMLKSRRKLNSARRKKFNTKG